MYVCKKLLLKKQGTYKIKIEIEILIKKVIVIRILISYLKWLI